MTEAWVSEGPLPGCTGRVPGEAPAADAVADSVPGAAHPRGYEMQPTAPTPADARPSDEASAAGITEGR